MIKKLYSNTIPGWKVTLLHQIKTNQGLKFKFHLTLDISVQKLTQFQTYCKIIFKNWCLLLASFPVLPSAIASQALWYDKHIKIDYKCIYSSEISKKGLNCVGDVFNENQKLKTWDELKQEYRFY